MVKSPAQERSPGLPSRKGPSAPSSPDPHQDQNVTSDDDATICGPEDSRLTVDPGSGSKTPQHRPRFAQNGTSPTRNGVTPDKTHHNPPDNPPPPPPIRPRRTPPLSSSDGPVDPPPSSRSPPPPSIPPKTPSPPLGPALNEATLPASHPRTPKPPPSPPRPPLYPPAPPTKTPPLSVVGASTPPPSSGSGFVPPPLPPASSPSPPSSSGREPIQDDQPAIHSPIPRTPAKPFGRLRKEMESYRKSHRGGDSSEEDEPVSIVFPHTYPARSRGESRTRAKTDADVTREVTTTMAQLQGRNSQEAITGKIGDRNVRDLWGELGKKRGDIYDLRFGMTSDRQALRELRRRKNDADNKMLSMVRQVLPRIGNEYRRSFADAQALRDEYTTQENLYEAREVALDKLEWELEVLETQFFAGLSQRAVADEDREEAPNETPEPSDHDDVPLELKGISRDGPPESIHPLYSRFQDAVGDFGLASESWHELLGALAEIEFKLTIDKHLEMERLDEEEMEFLREYSEEEARRLKQLQEARSRVEHLRKLCMEQGVMRKHLPFQMVYVLRKHFPTKDDDENDLGEDMELLDNAPSKLVKGGRARPFLWRLMSQEAHLFGEFPLLPPQALEVANNLPSDDPRKLVEVRDAEEELFLYEIFSSCPAHDTSEFVNRWLLHQLRISPHMAHLWYNEARDEEQADPLAWQECVLGEWWRDDALPIKGPEGSTRARDGENNSEGERELPISSPGGGDLAAETRVGVEVAV